MPAEVAPDVDAAANSIATCRIASARICVRSAASYASAARSKKPDPRRSAGEFASATSAGVGANRLSPMIPS